MIDDRYFLGFREIPNYISKRESSQLTTSLGRVTHFGTSHVFQVFLRIIGHLIFPFQLKFQVCTLSCRCRVLWELNKKLRLNQGLLGSETFSSFLQFSRHGNF